VRARRRELWKSEIPAILSGAGSPAYTKMTESDRFPNDEQRAVIEGSGGARLILAPAGTGKTRVMAARLSRAVKGGLDPGRSLAVTFTNRAAREMRLRVKEQLGGRAGEARIHTFHALCAWILRSEAPILGLPRDYVIYDEQDCIDLLKEVLANSRSALRGTTAAQFFWKLSSRKSGAIGPELSLSRIPPLFQKPGEEAERDAALRYHRVLAERQVLDFSDLVHRVRSLFELDAGVREAWERRFDWIQVDEVQDTHFSEYEVLRTLAARGGNLALFGDIDQTIYGWRGSEPAQLLARFERDFGPLRRHFLTINHRATVALLEAADRFADTFSDRKTQLVPHPALPRGEPVEVRVLATPKDEASFVAARIRRLLDAGQDRQIGVLARNHRRLEVLSAGLTAAGVEHVTVEQFEFFRRQEIKDALARVRLVLNPFDSGAARRVMVRPKCGIGAATLSALYEHGPPAGLRLTDLLRAESHLAGEPFRNLLDALEGGSVVVFDVETTGLSLEDEVIEIAAVRIDAGRGTREFHRYLRPSRKVGDSESIHGWSDAFLAEHGAEPLPALSEFVEFAEGAHLVGHNVRFDLEMVRAGCERAGVRFPAMPFDDTLDLARRLVPADRFDLSTLQQRLGLAARPTHRAGDDVAATVELLAHLRPLLQAGAAVRTELLARHGRPFEPLARAIADWRAASTGTRPAALLELLLGPAGLRDHYRSSPARLRHLDELVEYFRRHDDPGLSPLTALSALSQQAALARNVDHLDGGDPRIPVVTVHQSKGLEFDTVILCGLAEGEFPSFLAERDGRVEEERRLFYVALTRARRRLILTGHETGESGRWAGASRFLAELKMT